MGVDAGDRYTGIFQIDVYVPLGKGEEEANAKYNALAKLFSRGKYFDEVLIMRTYRAMSEPEIDAFRVVIRVEFRAVLERTV
jgi:hypothetical protein